MHTFRFRRQFIIACLLAAVGGLAVFHHWLQKDLTSFLPGHAGAEWIVDDCLPDNTAHRLVPSHTIFRRTFVLNTLPADATISLRAFKSAGARVNGHAVENLRANGVHWKDASTAAITPYLQAGTNEIVVTVTNNAGPPALWLHLQAGPVTFGTDNTWLSSPVPSHWLAARPATQPPTIPSWSPYADSERSTDSLLHLKWVLGGLLALTLVVFWAANRWRAQLAFLTPTQWLNALLIGIVIVRVALFINDAPKLPPTAGFDAEAHAEYIRFIQDKEALPLPNDGWEMHQPPLYYMGAAILMNILGLAAGDDNTIVPLRAINGVIGLVHCWLVLLCLRRLFPQNYPAQAIGLIVAGFLPVNQYPSLYVLNDPLAGLLVTLALYLTLRFFDEGANNIKLAAAIGVAIGAALLTKLSTLLAVPVIIAALMIKLLSGEKTQVRDWLRSVGVVLLACFITCGWHYIRVWIQIGGLPLPNCQTDTASAWWQYPAYRTADYYLGFGHALLYPTFSGQQNFADGIYSTLWADGLISGRSQTIFQPPWNHDLMNTGCLLAAVLTVLLLFGLMIYLCRFFRQPEPVPWLLPMMILAFIAGILLLTIHGPWLAHTKAFYALPALAPFSALIAAGWWCIAEKSRAAGRLLALLIIAWAFTAYGAFWISGNNFEFWRTQTITELRAQQPDAAMRDITHALQLKPDDADSLCIQAELLIQAGHAPEAIQNYERAFKLSPDSPYVANDLAQMLATGDRYSLTRAVELVRGACEQTHYRQLNLVTMLAAVCAKAGLQQEAINAATVAEDLATQWGDQPVAAQNRALLDQLAAPNASGVK